MGLRLDEESFQIDVSNLALWLAESVIEPASIWKPFLERPRRNAKKKQKLEDENIKLLSHGVFIYPMARKFSSEIVIACAPVAGVIETSV